MLEILDEIREKRDQPPRLVATAAVVVPRRVEQHVPDAQQLVDDLAAGDLEHDQGRVCDLVEEAFGDVHDLAHGRLAVQQRHDADQRLGAGDLHRHVAAAVAVSESVVAAAAVLLLLVAVVSVQAEQDARFAGFQPCQGVEQRRRGGSVGQYDEGGLAVLVRPEAEDGVLHQPEQVGDVIPSRGPGLRFRVHGGSDARVEDGELGFRHPNDVAEHARRVDLEPVDAPEQPSSIVHLRHGYVAGPATFVMEPVLGHQRVVQPQIAVEVDVIAAL